MDFDIATKPQMQGAGVGKIYYAKIQDMETIGTIFAAPANQGEKVTIENAHTFTGTEGFREIYSSPKKKVLTVTQSGDEELGTFTSRIEAFFPGNKKEFDAFLKDDPELILLINTPDCGDTEYIQVGTACNPARIVKDSEYNSGNNGGDTDRGTVFRIEGYASSKIYYDQVVTLATA